MAHLVARVRIGRGGITHLTVLCVTFNSLYVMLQAFLLDAKFMHDRCAFASTEMGREIV